MPLDRFLDLVSGTIAFEKDSQISNVSQSGDSTKSSPTTTYRRRQARPTLQPDLDIVEDPVTLGAPHTLDTKTQTRVQQQQDSTSVDPYRAGGDFGNGLFSSPSSQSSPPPLSQSTLSGSSSASSLGSQASTSSPHFVGDQSVSSKVKSAQLHSSAEDRASERNMASTSTATAMDHQQSQPFRRSASTAHSRISSNGSNQASNDQHQLLSASAGSSGSTGSASNNTRSHRRKSATPSAINTSAANALSASTSSNKSATSAASGSGVSPALSGLLSPTSAAGLTMAQQSALERALAAGISRHEFEKARSSVVSMLRGPRSQSSSQSVQQSAPDSSLRRSVTPQPLPGQSAASEAGVMTSEDKGSPRSHDKLPRLAISGSADAAAGAVSGPRKRVTSTGKSDVASSLASSAASSSLQPSDAGSSFSQPQASTSSAPTSAAPSLSASTLRTSVSSNATDDVFSQKAAQDSPLTSDDGDASMAQADSSSTRRVTRGQEKKQGQSRKKAARATRETHDDQDGQSDQDMTGNDTGRQHTPPALAQQPHQDMLLDDPTSQGLQAPALEEDDTSFSAATAAAAALGMLASSPVKVVERRRTRSPNRFAHQQPFMNGASGTFSQHRQPHSASGLASSSSPQGTLAGGSNAYLSTSPTAGGSRSPVGLTSDDGGLSHRSRSETDKSTTPVRTRLEDIALKSSAQIRRQRELLNLGEEEMLDLDTDARHENALLRGASLSAEDSLGSAYPHLMQQSTSSAVSDAHNQPHQPQHSRTRSLSRRGHGINSRRRYRDAVAAAEAEEGYYESSEPFSAPARSTRSVHTDDERMNEDAALDVDDAHERQEQAASPSGLAPAFSYPHSTASPAQASARQNLSRSGRTGFEYAKQEIDEQPLSRSAKRHTRTPSRLGRGALSSSTNALSSAGPSSALSAISSSARRGHHRRISSFGMSGMMDRFMESSYSPKAAQIAKFEEAVRRASPERSAYDTDRTISAGRHHEDDLDEDAENDEDDEFYQEEDDAADLPAEVARSRQHSKIHSTPRTHMDRSKLLRSAGNDLPSPLLHQIRMLSDTDQSPHVGAERLGRERGTPRFSRGASGYSAHQELGLASGHGSSSEFGSARKRKASYDLQSPRHLVRGLQNSPTLEEDENEDYSDPRALSPPRFPHFAQADPRFFERTATGHPASASGLFDGPTPSHSQTSSQSSSTTSYPLSQSQLQAQDQPHARSGKDWTQTYSSRDPHYGHHPHPENLHRSRHQPYPEPAYQQAYAQPVYADEEPGHYAIAAPRQPMRTYPHPELRSENLSRSGTAGSDYIPNQRDLKKREKATKKQHQEGHDREEKPRPAPALSRSSSSVPLAAAPSSSSSTPMGLENFVPANVKQGQYDEKTKPPFSYAALIGQAIFSTPNRRMSLADIYTYIMTLFPFYKKQDAGWQNSIRHNLSLNECFVKTQRAPDEPGKGCLWSILPGTEEQFTGGNFYKKGKVPKPSSSKPTTAEHSVISNAPSSVDGSKRIKASSVASASDAMSAMSGDESFETGSVNSSTFISNSSAMHYPPPHPAYAHPRGSAMQYGYSPHGGQQAYYVGPQYQHGPPPIHGPSLLRDHRQHAGYREELEPQSAYDDDEDSFDMDQPDARYSRSEQAAPPPHRPRLIVRQPKVRNDRAMSSEEEAKRESSPEGEDFIEPRIQPRGVLARAPPPPELDRSFSESDRSGSLEPVKPTVPPSSPVRRGAWAAHERHKSNLTSPPIMSSPPTNVFARMSQPYQPLRNTFNIPSNAHAEALMSSPPPSSGIMPSDMRMRRLPPPTPRSSGLEDDEHAGSHIFLPAPNIKPGKASLSRKDGGEDGHKPTLPPISMMSPASAMALNTQSPVSSVRGSATKRSSSPSPKSSSQLSSSGTSVTRSPTLSKSTHLGSAEVFKTPDRFAAPSYRAINSPNKLAHLTNNNASKALQSLQSSTPKLGGTRPTHGLTTPGNYYDPYEYGANLDEELDRMMAVQRETESVNRHGDRRPLPFPSPLDRTPKWQPWSPW